MNFCLWCGKSMERDSEGNLTCPNECQDDCSRCGDVIGDCHEDGECQGAVSAEVLQREAAIERRRKARQESDWHTLTAAAYAARYGTRR